jgi:integrase
VTRRSVPAGQQLVKVLKEWRLACPAGAELVFPSRTGGPLLLGNMRRDLIGPTKLHALRHFYASWLLSQGEPLTVVQRRMGHSTIALTADRYGHLLPPDAEGRARLAAAEAKLLG